MKVSTLYQKRILQAAVGCEGLAVITAELKLTDNRLLGGGVCGIRV